MSLLFDKAPSFPLCGVFFVDLAGLCHCLPNWHELQTGYLTEDVPEKEGFMIGGSSFCLVCIVPWMVDILKCPKYCCAIKEVPFYYLLSSCWYHQQPSSIMVNFSLYWHIMIINVGNW